MPFGLNNTTLEKINSIFYRFPEVEKVLIYGSRAKGTYKPGSDIDITLFGIYLNSELRSRISLELDDLLLPYEIDLSIFAELHNCDLIAQINRIGKIFYSKEEEVSTQ